MLRGLIFLLLVSALAQTTLIFPQMGRSVVFIIDRSASIQNEQLALDWVKRAVAQKQPEDRFALISVADRAVVEQAWQQNKQVDSLQTVINQHATNLASGLRLAAGLLPSTAKGKVVLLTDGKETTGNAKKELLQFQQRGIPVDIVSLASKQGPEVFVDSIDVPKQLHQDDHFQLQLFIRSTIKTTSKLRILEAGKPVLEREVTLNPGNNKFSFPVIAKQDGFLRYQVEIVPKVDTIVQNNQAYAFSEVQGKPRVLIVEEQGTDSENLVRSLAALGIASDRMKPDVVPDRLESLKRYSSLLLVNVPAYSFTEKQIKQMQIAVRDLGIGMGMIGGENSFALGGWYQTPLEQALPVYMDIRDQRRMPSLGLMLVIDKSGSMIGEKIELAKKAAMRSASLLTGQDQLGVIAFDDGMKWVLKPQSLTNKNAVNGLISNIPADGGTNIYPSLDTAYQSLSKLKVKRKHVILLTDGQAPNNKFQALTQKWAKKGITLSTVAVGTDADQKLLQQLAVWGKGRSYLANHPQAIPTIFSKETILSKRSYIVNQPIIPEMNAGNDLGLSAVPPLLGYVGTTAKQTSEKVILSPHFRDPILARWQYGLGRTFAFTSDVSGKWSKAWTAWSQATTFWNQVVGWTFSQSGNGGFDLRPKLDQEQPKLEVYASEAQLKTAPTIAFNMVDQSGESKKIEVKATAKDKYEGSLPALEPGTYFLQGVAGKGKNQKRLGTFGFVVPYSSEYRPNTRTIDLTKLGKIQPDPSMAFRNSSEGDWEKQEITFWLLLVATLLWPVDIAARRLSFDQIFSWRKKRATIMETKTEQSAIAKIKQQSSQAIVNRKKRWNTIAVNQEQKPETAATKAPKKQQETKHSLHSSQGLKVDRLLQAKKRIRKKE